VKCIWIAAAFASVVGANACHAQEGVDKASNDLVAGADDKIFRVDRTDLHERSGLVTGRKELAALRHK
jgi:hypothetical protein